MAEPQEPTLPFRLPPASHTHDPSTSKDAELEHTLSGVRGAHCQVVLAAVIANPLRTASELTRFVPYDLQETRRRLTDLGHAGRVSQCARKRAPGRTKDEMTWSVTADD